MRKHTPDSASLSLFDGKVCRKCGLWSPFHLYSKDKGSPDGFFRWCKPCAASHHARWYGETQEQRRVVSRVYYQANTERENQRGAEYRRDNPERMKRLWAKRRIEDPERYNAEVREYRKRKPHIVRALDKAHGNKRRALKAGNGGSFTRQEWETLCDQYGNRCLCCGRTDRPLTVDHVLPITQGGRNDIANLQPLCGPCNSRKRDKTIDYRPGHQAPAVQYNLSDPEAP